MQKFLQRRLSPDTPDVIIRDTGIEFRDDFRIHEFTGDLFEDHQPILDCDNPADGRESVTRHWISSPLPFGRPGFRLRFLLGTLALLGASPSLLGFVATCCLFDFRPTITEFLEGSEWDVPELHVPIPSRVSDLPKFLDNRP